MLRVCTTFYGMDEQYIIPELMLKFHFGCRRAGRL